MKAVVLAGGYATRLWPITKQRPKMFLPIGETTVIDRIFADLEADERVDTVYVSTNERFADDFRDHLAESDFEKPQLSVEDTSEEDEKFGVVGALAQLVEREEVDDDLVVIAGDNLISFDVGDFVNFFEEKGSSCLAAYDVGTKERAKAYGLVELDGDRVVDFQEKPDDPNSTLVSIACYAFTEETLPLLETYLEDGNNPDEPGWFLQWLQSRKPVYAYTFEEAWFDIGTPESYLDAVSWYLGGESRVADSATLENTTVGENVHVMDGAELADANLENAIIFPNATVRGGDVRDSIIDEGTHIENMDLAGALIGAHTQITNESDE
ncbi:Nucleotidyl transferase [Haladaptatus paucihalophilus DX253]|uniref:Glucose-1-phosphate thymidylyltransferase n=1 Tax=Haladaptatus paucihalophilus DX253 TaxID=797209 RepID=E7QWT5_HALPU|nr:NDP-sugar synthase [Haladaptatus paucihalophilus]EFW90738.1 Nucleotidyl transferase [Haladaptatus paucihalophilus DX253]SHK20951.1 glucose-1-phosphate thymidylyltransferase [Haladaptatus paucihalophilus DX253]